MQGSIPPSLVPLVAPVPLYHFSSDGWQWGAAMSPPLDSGTGVGWLNSHYAPYPLPIRSLCLQVAPVFPANTMGTSTIATCGGFEALVPYMGPTLPTDAFSGTISKPAVPLVSSPQSGWHGRPTADQELQEACGQKQLEGRTGGGHEERAQVPIVQLPSSTVAQRSQRLHAARCLPAPTLNHSKGPDRPTKDCEQQSCTEAEQEPSSGNTAPDRASALDPQTTTTLKQSQLPQWPRKYRGVCQVRNERWRVKIYHAGHVINIGHFTDARPGAMAYDLAVLHLRGPRAQRNFSIQVLKHAPEPLQENVQAAIAGAVATLRQRNATSQAEAIRLGHHTHAFGSCILCSRPVSAPSLHVRDSAPSLVEPATRWHESSLDTGEQEVHSITKRSEDAPRTQAVATYHHIHGSVPLEAHRALYRARGAAGDTVRSKRLSLQRMVCSPNAGTSHRLGTGKKRRLHFADAEKQPHCRRRRKS